MGEHESTRVKAKVTSFIPANEFEGPKAGYFFKKGKKGLGYYLDKRGNKEKLKKASKEAKQTKSKAEKSKSETKVSTHVSDNVPKKRKMHADDSENESATEEILAANNDKVDEPPKSFKELGVVPELVAACESIGWTNATPIQVEAIPPALEGRDLIALAETGSGKTGAFSLPLLQGLLKHQQRLYATVLAPTRELAFQINEVVTALGAPIGCKCVCVVGGIDMMSQQIALAKKPHVVIATPGRLIDHLEKTKGFNLRSLKLLVLDEADRMLSMDFEEELNKLLTVIPRDRNTYLFSATMTSKVAKLQRASLRNPVKVEVSSKYQTVKQLNQQYLFVPAKYKDCYLTYVLNELAGQTCLVFTSTCAHAQKATMMLRNLGFQALCLHGQMSQSKRLGALSKFKAGSRNILIATDVASRGLDIPSVGLVVNYDVPSNGKDYIHRVGRTARAGRAGRAVTLVTQYDVEVYTRIEEMIGKKLEQFPAEKEAVLVMYERVFEAQRVAALEMREMNQGNKRYRDDGDEEGGDVAGLMDTFRGRGGRRGGRGGSRGGGRGGSRGRRGRR